jgi:hypothetical protein
MEKQITVEEWLKDAYYSEGSQSIFNEEGNHIADK